MGRPWDWSPLAGADPVPGDPVGVGEAARHYAQIAHEITAQAQHLRALAPGARGGGGGGARHYAQIAHEITAQAQHLRALAQGTGDAWDADAGRVFRDHAGDLAGRITKAQARYEAAARTLDHWSASL